MTHKQIIEELKHLPTIERLRVVEEVLHLIEKDITQPQAPQISTNLKNQLTKAANSLLSDYTDDSELTVFTSININPQFCKSKKSSLKNSLNLFSLKRI
ncbi:MAG: hypothetical protein Q8K98_05625 [Bacteroidota bacterium]|nr:hypothetical protein [Bacteroidota bacterium]